MDVSNALSTPVTPFADSRERLIAQVAGRAAEVKGPKFQYASAPAAELHTLERHALVLRYPFPRICEQVLERTSTYETYPCVLQMLVLNTEPYGSVFNHPT